MSNAVFVEQLGQGPNLVMLHGWGMNGACWHSVTTALAPHFRLHVVDLPGYGHSEALPAQQHGDQACLQAMAEAVLAAVPEQATWLGWSLGGLVATQAALMAPTRVERLITVASSPKFTADPHWSGIQPQVLSSFATLLTSDWQKTLERFLAVQAMGSVSARQDVKQLRRLLLARPQPDMTALQSGLQLLEQVDLRGALPRLQCPVVRFYGRLDTLVPTSAIAGIDALLPESQRYLFERASHAPFISYSDEFIDAVLDAIMVEAH